MVRLRSELVSKAPVLSVAVWITAGPIRTPSGVTIVSSIASGDSADVTFARIGRSEPRLQLRVPGGSVALTAGGCLSIAAPGMSLAIVRRTTPPTTGAAPGSSCWDSTSPTRRARTS